MACIYPSVAPRAGKRRTSRISQIGPAKRFHGDMSRVTQDNRSPPILVCSARNPSIPRATRTVTNANPLSRRAVAPTHAPPTEVPKIRNLSTSRKTGGTEAANNRGRQDRSWHPISGIGEAVPEQEPEAPGRSFEVEAHPGGPRRSARGSGHEFAALAARIARVPLARLLPKERDAELHIPDRGTSGDRPPFTSSRARWARSAPPPFARGRSRVRVSGNGVGPCRHRVPGGSAASPRSSTLFLLSSNRSRFLGQHN
jgi:hypothetical protein